MHRLFGSLIFTSLVMQKEIDSENSSVFSTLDLVFLLVEATFFKKPKGLSFQIGSA